jgi:formate dehydrogenase
LRFDQLHAGGAEDLIGEVTAGVDPQAIRAPCMGRCATAPAARIGDREVDHASSQGLLNMAREGTIKVVVPDYIGLEAYRAAGGYQLLQKVRDGALGVDAIMETMQNAGLRGLGGAGFPAGKKWGFVRSYPGPRLMSINGDEGEPGTFKEGTRTGPSRAR